MSISKSFTRYQDENLLLTLKRTMLRCSAFFESSKIQSELGLGWIARLFVTVLHCRTSLCEYVIAEWYPLEVREAFS